MDANRHGLSATQIDVIANEIAYSLCCTNGMREAQRRVVIRLALESGRSAAKKAVDEWAEIRSAYIAATAGGLSTENNLNAYDNARDGKGYWLLREIVPESLLSTVHSYYAGVKKGIAAREHYADRRKEANSAIASKSLRAQVFERHGEACLKCGETDRLSIDHIVPVSLGGTDHIDNLQVLCGPCNSAKGSNLEVQSDITTDILTDAGEAAYSKAKTP